MNNMRIFVGLFLLVSTASMAESLPEVEDMPPEKLNVLIDKQARVLTYLKMQEQIVNSKVSINKKLLELDEKKPPSAKSVVRVHKPTRRVYSRVQMRSLFRSGDVWGAILSIGGTKVRAVPGAVLFGRYRVESCAATGCVLTDLVTGKTIRVHG